MRLEYIFIEFGQNRNGAYIRNGQRTNRDDWCTLTQYGPLDPESLFVPLISMFINFSNPFRTLSKVDGFTFLMAFHDCVFISAFLGS